MSSFIQNKIYKEIRDGARSTKFDCEIYFTNTDLVKDSDYATIVKTTKFPSKTHSKIDLMYKGRPIPVRGQTKYNQTWTATFYLSEDHRLKNAFEIWMEAIDERHNYEPYLPGVPQTKAKHKNSGYTSAITLYQRDFKDEENTAVYTLFNVFPIEVSELDYSAESLGQVQEFTVTFAYTHYMLQTVKGNANNFVDELIQKALNFATDKIEDLKAGFDKQIVDLLNSTTSERGQLVKNIKDVGETIEDLLGK